MSNDHLPTLDRTQVAAIYGGVHWGARTVRRADERGDLRGYSIGRKRLYAPADVEIWLLSRGSHAA